MNNLIHAQAHHLYSDAAGITFDFGAGEVDVLWPTPNQPSYCVSSARGVAEFLTFADALDYACRGPFVEVV